ncbi:hypothetical protein ACFC0M_10790 [Streptomyces sp. NPDC056149]|uniref:hypothetical protein n=1 Tax=Streptomyces sp. NPDC056149 TaxID=3345728 RepID=UPI0035DC3474
MHDYEYRKSAAPHWRTPKPKNDKQELTMHAERTFRQNRWNESLKKWARPSITRNEQFLGTTLSVSYLTTDPTWEERLTMAREALKKVKDAGADLPSHLNIILSGGGGEGAIAFVGNPSPDIFLGAPSQSAAQEIRKGTEGTVRGGVPTSGNLHGMPHIVAAGAQGKRKDKRRYARDQFIATTIHEIGHILHARHSDDFLKYKCGESPHDVPGDLQAQVSFYAVQKQNPLEFVAEVFTGLVYGEEFSDAVLAKYKELGGPPAGLLKR